MEASFGAMGAPPEIWMAIAHEIDNLRDLAVLTQVSRGFHAAINPFLYDGAIKSGIELRAIFWGVRYGLAQTVRHALAAGVDVNITWKLTGSVSESWHLVPTYDDCRRSIMLPYHDEERDYTVYPSMHWSPLHLAAYLGNVAMMQLLLDHRAQTNLSSANLCPCRETQPYNSVYFSSTLRPNFSFQHRWTPYHVAVCAGNIPAASLMASRGDHEMESPIWDSSTQSTGSSAGLNPLHVASISGQEKMIQWLIDSDYGYGLEALDLGGRTPLMYAYLFSKWDCLMTLIRNGADINRPRRSYYGRFYEDHTSNQGREDYLETSLLADSLTPLRFGDAIRLIEFGANPVLADQSIYKDLPLVHKLCSRSWDDIYDPTGPTSQDMKAEICAAGMTILNCFLEHGLDFQQTASCGLDELGFSAGAHTALGHAAWAGNKEAVQRLIQFGADVNGNPERDSNTPLTNACKGRYNNPMLDMVTLLLNSGASPNRLRAGTRAPLWVLPDVDPEEESDDLKATRKVLLEHGSNPGRGTSSGDTVHYSALDRAIRNGELEVVDYHLSMTRPKLFGEDDFLGFWKVVTAMSESEKILRYVIEKDTDGVIARKMPLALTFLLDMDPIEPDLVITMIERGADPNVDWEGHSPLGYVLAQSSWSVNRKTAVIRPLVVGKASIHHPLNHQHFPRLENEAPCTPLGVAIHGRDHTIKLVETMIEHQPLQEIQENDLYQYILQACCIGNRKALSAIIGSTDASVPVLQKNADKIMHFLLDGLCEKCNTIREANTAIECIELLVHAGANLSAFPPSKSPDYRTAKEKILNPGHPSLGPSSPIGSKWRAIAWCLQQRVGFPTDSCVPTFKKDNMHLFFQLYISLEQLGRMLQNKSRTWILS